MKNARMQYLTLIGVTIILGLISRRISIVPLFIGDILWAIMMFFIVRVIFIKSKIRVVFLVSLILCMMIEVSQLYQVEWLNNLRRTIPGRLVLGQGFLWSDIICYTIGVIAATIFEKCKIQAKRKELK